MPSLVVFVLDNPEYMEDVLQAWQDAGSAGATVLPSTGLNRVGRLFGSDDIPLLPSIRDLAEHCEECVHYTIFSVVQDEAIVDKVIAATERIVGDLAQPGTGILFVVPVSRVVGGQFTEKKTQGVKA